MAMTLPSRARLLLFAVLLPAAVAGTNQLVFESVSSVDWSLRPWLLYASLSLTTALLSWGVGRYLEPPWLRWLVFAWCLALLDLLTMAACLERKVEPQLGYVLISAQASLLVLWAVLGREAWQIRLSVVAVLTLFVISFTDFLALNRHEEWAWNVIMMTMTPVMALLCGGLRYFGFSLLRADDMSLSDLDGTKPRTIQFGVKHMLIWLTIAGPFLVVVRGIDFRGEFFFPAMLIGISLATVNLVAIWAVLGSGYWLIRLLALLALPHAIATGLTYYSDYWNSYGLTLTGAARDRWYSSFAIVLAEMKDYWRAWLWLSAALLAALLLFLRASGYRLARTRRA